MASFADTSQRLALGNQAMSLDALGADAGRALFGGDLKEMNRA